MQMHSYKALACVPIGVDRPMQDKTERARRAMANELTGYLRHHGQEEAAELVKEYVEEHEP